MATSLPRPPPPPPPKPKSNHNKINEINNANNNINGNGNIDSMKNNYVSNNNNIRSSSSNNSSYSNNNHHIRNNNHTNILNYNNEDNNNIVTTDNSSIVPSIDEEKVVMTPKGKTSNSTVILIERKLVEEINERQHVAGGDHTGIIINKDTQFDQKSEKIPPQLCLEFRVFLVSANTGQHSQESRTLRFWFRSWLTDGDKQAHVAQDFFRELVSPKEFPRGKIIFFVCIRIII